MVQQPSAAARADFRLPNGLDADEESKQDHVLILEFVDKSNGKKSTSEYGTSSSCCYSFPDLPVTEKCSPRRLR
jgi:hypothetical protein